MGIHDLPNEFVAGEHIIIQVGGQNDGPGYIIYVGSDGKVHVKRVPGRDPGVKVQFDAAVSILEHAALTKDASIEKRLTASAQESLAPIAQKIYTSTVGK